MDDKKDDKELLEVLYFRKYRRIVGPYSGDTKYYNPIFIVNGKVRPSRKVFRTATKCVEYGKIVVKRLLALQSIAMQGIDKEPAL